MNTRRKLVIALGAGALAVMALMGHLDGGTSGIGHSEAAC